MIRYLLILLLCCSLAFGDQISQEVVGAQADDGGFLRGSANLSTTGTTHSIGRNIAGASYFFGARFQTVPIPAGSTIDSVVMTIDAGSSSSANTVNWAVHCEDTADATQFSDTTDYFARNITSAAYQWASVPAFTADTAYKIGGSTANIKAPFVELFARTDWASGNDIVVLIYDSSSTNNRTRVLASYDHATYTEPRLDIWYTPPSGVPSVYHGVAGIGRLHSPAGNSVLHKK